MSGRQEAHSQKQQAQNPEGFVTVPLESVTQPTACPEIVMF